MTRGRRARVFGAVAVLLVTVASLLWIVRSRLGPTRRDEAETLANPDVRRPTPPRRPRFVEDKREPVMRDYLTLYEGKSGLLGTSARKDATATGIQLTSADAVPTLTVTTPRTFYLATDAAEFRATLDRLDKVDDLSLTLEIAPFGAPDRTFTMPLRPRASATGQYDAHVPLEQAAFAPTSFNAAGVPRLLDVQFRITARGTRLGHPFVRTVASSFNVNRPGAALVEGAPRVRREAGDVLLDVSIDVKKAGTYWTYAELWSATGEGRAIAFGRQHLGRLAPGVHKVTLLFGGAIIHDVGIDGPYVVRNVQLSQVDEPPPHTARIIKELPATPAWRAREFGSSS